MPTITGHSTTTTICSGCGVQAAWSAYGYEPQGGETDIDSGRPVSDTFRLIRGRDRQRYHTLCRSCERERNAQRRANGGSRRRSARVPGTYAAALGATRKFGVELELALPRHVGRQDIRHALSSAGITSWTIKGDPSIRVNGMTGVEIVSPPLAGDEGEQQVRTVCRVLRELGGKVNRTCGTHTHHDVSDLDTDALKRMIQTWTNNQPLIDGLVAPSRRPGGSTYCAPLSSSETRALLAATNFRTTIVSRYRTLNMTAYGRHGTVEIRQHQGTLDAEKIMSWIRLGQAMLDAAKTRPAAITRQSRVRDLLRSLDGLLDDTAETFLLGRAVRFDLVAV